MAAHAVTIPTCRAEYCAGVADHSSGLCAAHRRALTLSTTMQDTVTEFLHVQHGGTLQSSVALVPANTEKVERAGHHLALALALLVSTCFESEVTFDETPISLRNVSHGAKNNWRVAFNWQAGRPEFVDDELDAYDDEDDDDIADAL